MTGEADAARLREVSVAGADEAHAAWMRKAVAGMTSEAHAAGTREAVAARITGRCRNAVRGIPFIFYTNALLFRIYAARGNALS